MNARRNHLGERYKVDAIVELIKKGNTAAQIANRVGTSRQYVSLVARRNGLTPRQDVLARVAVDSAPESALMVKGGGARQYKKGDVSHEVDDVSTKSLSKQARNVAMDIPRGSGHWDKERKLSWIKHRHEMYRLQKKHGVKLKS
jgi:transcriptional regulator with XRE-family HTH domain